MRCWAILLIAGAFGLGTGPNRASAQTTASRSQATTPSTASLLRNAQEQIHKGNRAQAERAWKQVLLAEPRNAEALAGLAGAAALDGDYSLATTYLDRLRKVNPNDPHIPALEKIEQEQREKKAWATAMGQQRVDRPHPGSPEMAAYQALNAKQLADAELKFKAILAGEPGNASALAGMGFVRMQQGNYLGAISYLEQARQKDPGDQSVLAALDAARFWFILGEGQHALSSGDLQTADKRFHAALDLRPDSPEALDGLGDTLLREQHPQPAVALFESAVAHQSTNVDAWRGLVISRFESGDAQGAVAANAHMPQTIAAQLARDPLFLETLASAYTAAGRDAEAQKLLEAAVALPFPPEAKGAKAGAQAQLAKALASDNRNVAAAALYRQALAEDTGNIAAWKGLILAEHASGHEAEALKALDSMPPAARQESMQDPEFEATIAAALMGQGKLDEAQKALEQATADESKAGRRPSAALQVQLANLDIQRGTPQLAYPIFQQLLREDPNRVEAWAGLLSTLHLTGHDQDAEERLAFIPPSVRIQLERNPVYLQTMAAVYGDLGRSHDAAQFLDRAEQNSAAQQDIAPAEVEIQKAWLLYNGLDDAGLYRQLMRLGQRPDLTDAQRSTVQTIWANWAVRRADLAEAAGHKQMASSILDAAAQTFPDNPSVLKQLAGAFAQQGHADRAVEIYKSVNMSSGTPADYEIAIGAALAIGDTKDARTWMHTALAAYPKDPRMLLLAAKMEQARGDANLAMDYYRKSLDSMPRNPKPPLPMPSSGDPSKGPVDLSLSALLAPPGSLTGARSSYAEPSSSGLPRATAPMPVPAAQAQPAAEVQPAVRQEQATASSGNEYRPYIGYIAPPPQTPAITTSHPAGSKDAIPVQLGNAAAPPIQPESEMTDVLPTTRYVPKSERGSLNDPNVAAERAAQIRRLQAETASRSGQSHPPDDGSIVASEQVGQPSAQPSRKRIPDTGAQQYPQPRVQPAPPHQGNQVRKVQPPTAPPAPAPVVNPPVDLITMPPPPAGPPAAAAVNPPFLPIPSVAGPSDAELAGRSMSPGAFVTPSPLFPVNPRRQAQTGLASLEGESSGWLGATGEFRYRAGTAGLDQLSDVETPIDASTMPGRSARLTAVVLPVFLNAGALNVSGAKVYPPYLGTLPATTAFAPAQQSSSGVGGELQLNTRAFGVAAGYTPYQFLVHSFTGRLRFSPVGEKLTLFGERQPVKDTQLSYAGLHDPGAVSTVVAGPVWGGVVATTGGIGLDLRDRISGSGFYAVAQGGVLTGRHVQDNYRYGGTVGAAFQMLHWADAGSLTVGGEFAGFHYNLNEVGMSYGQGGYFSPEYYLRAGVPVEARGSFRKNLHYEATGSIGVQTFRQAMSVFYPLDAALQAGFASCANPQTPSFACGEYPSTVTTRFNYRLRAETSYLSGQHWYTGGFVTADNANNYNEITAGFFFRYTFRAQVFSEGKPTGLFSADGLRPVRIP